jgi:outer membrane protein OmpA-like peptidoglycan-associated protein
VSAARQLGLSEGTLGAGFGDQQLSPVAATVALATDRAVLTGAFPEQGALDLFIKSATDAFGEANVDSSGAFVDSSTTMDGATILVTGLLDAGDTRGQGMMSAFGASFPGLAVDSSGLAIDNSAEALGRLEDKLRAAIEINPILFETGSANIDVASDAILEEAAAAIKATPGVPVEIVGHTDSQGGDDLNQTLSEARASAVLDRLVELGVDAEGLSARGAGEAEPVADNGTDEGRAANRRIAFEFEGASN